MGFRTRWESPRVCCVLVSHVWWVYRMVGIPWEPRGQLHPKSGQKRPPEASSGPWGPCKQGFLYRNSDPQNLVIFAQRKWGFMPDFRKNVYPPYGIPTIFGSSREGPFPSQISPLCVRPLGGPQGSPRAARGPPAPKSFLAHKGTANQKAQEKTQGPKGIPWVPFGKRSFVGKRVFFSKKP